MNTLVFLREMRQFLILWFGQMISSLGTSMVSFALIIWVYQQEGTATSVALLSFFTYLPSILFSFLAGTFVDKWDKKRVMLISDLVAAIGTVMLFILYGTDALKIWHLYAINFTISFMNAFQNPASYVATSLLVPKEHYARASGLQSFSGASVTILTPLLAAAILAFGGLRTVFIIDLVTFAFAFLTLLFFVKIPVMEKASEVNESFRRNITAGLRFLREHAALLKLILFFAFVNLLAYLTGFGILPAMILARTGNDQAILGIVTAAGGIGTLIGSILVTISKPPKDRIRTIFLALVLSFVLCEPALAAGRTTWIWVIAMLGGYIPLPFMNASLSVTMRANVPIEMQGRVFAARDTLQFFTIPLGLLLGGFLADNVFEPLMQQDILISRLLAIVVGSGNGSGMAVMFLITGIVGTLASLYCLRSSTFKTLG